jgi:hypothetical protein
MHDVLVSELPLRALSQLCVLAIFCSLHPLHNTGMSGLQWTTPALWALSALCLSANAPEHAALAAPLLLVVDLFQRSRQSLNMRTVNTVRQPTGQEKRKVRRLNGEPVYQDIILVRQVNNRD